MRQIVDSAAYASLMLAAFAGLMTFGFWLRHGHWIWENLA